MTTRVAHSGMGENQDWPGDGQHGDGDQGQPAEVAEQGDAHQQGQGGAGRPGRAAAATAGSWRGPGRWRSRPTARPSTPQMTPGDEDQDRARRRARRTMSPGDLALDRRAVEAGGQEVGSLMARVGPDWPRHWPWQWPRHWPRPPPPGPTGLGLVGFHLGLVGVLGLEQHADDDRGAEDDGETGRARWHGRADSRGRPKMTGVTANSKARAEASSRPGAGRACRQKSMVVLRWGSAPMTPERSAGECYGIRRDAAANPRRIQRPPRRGASPAPTSASIRRRRREAGPVLGTRRTFGRQTAGRRRQRPGRGAGAPAAGGGEEV